MTTTLAKNDLLTRLTKEELDELTTTAIESGQADPVQKAIDGGLGEIKLSIDADAFEALSAEMLYRVWLSLAVPLLYPRRGPVPDHHLKEQVWARVFLERARQGQIKPAGSEVVQTPMRPVTRDSLKGI